MERAEELKRMLKPMAVQPTDMLTSHCSDGENAGSGLYCFLFDVL